MKMIFYYLLPGLALLGCSQKQATTSKSIHLTQAAIHDSRQAANDSIRLYYISQVCTQLQKEEEAQPNPDYWGGILYDLPLFLDVIQRIKPNHLGVFMDVGSGNGEKLFASLCLGFEQAIGIEYNPDLVKMSQQNFPRLHQQQTLITHQGDALSIDAALFHQADLIYLYSPIKDTQKMAQLLERVIRHMKDGATILEVNAYYTTTLQQISHLKFPTLYGGWLAIKKEGGKYFVAQTFYSQGANWLPLTVK
ncbi:MAG TPA: hypothetical protein DCS93_33210 [Microscillaceae bacterium]|nr:hypothetical protein [Microscillaceae bacterium]